MAEQWFEHWFDSPYYHQLYSHRDESEAEAFLKALVRTAEVPEAGKVLDLACGRGRHSRVLSKLGYEVYGLDYSSNNIQAAIELSEPSLHFKRHDMRDPFPWQNFDLICNLFTSFGYFPSDKEHLDTLTNCYHSMNPGAKMILDFLNIEWVKQNTEPTQERVVDGIAFSLNKRIADGYLINSISFEAEGEKQYYEERVRAFSKDDLLAMFKRIGFEISAVFGSYDLKTFNSDNSDRLIVLASK